MIGKQIGIALEDFIEYDLTGKATRSISEVIGDHKLFPLLNHSDCEGTLTPLEAFQIAEGLQEIFDAMTDYDKAIQEDFINDLVQFRAGCMEAYSKNEIIDFH